MRAARRSALLRDGMGFVIRSCSPGGARCAGAGESRARLFVPAVIEPPAVPVIAEGKSASARRRSRRRSAAAVELEIDGVCVKIGRGAEAGVIAAVIDALKTTR